MASDPESFESGPTYKLLFLGACGIIFSFIGWWVTDLKHAVERLTVRIDQCETRNTQLEKEFSEYKFRLYRLEEDYQRTGSTLDAQNKAISELEREIRRGKRRD